MLWCRSVIPCILGGAGLQRCSQEARQACSRTGHHPDRGAALPPAALPLPMAPGLLGTHFRLRKKQYVDLIYSCEIHRHCGHAMHIGCDQCIKQIMSVNCPAQLTFLARLMPSAASRTSQTMFTANATAAPALPGMTCSHMWSAVAALKWVSDWHCFNVMLGSQLTPARGC